MNDILSSRDPDENSRSDLEDSLNRAWSVLRSNCYSEVNSFQP